MPEPTRPKLHLVTVVVGDMPASVAFYRALGVDVPDGEPPWDAHHRSANDPDGGVDIDLDSASFAPKWNEGWPAGETGMIVGFQVDERSDVDGLYAQLVAAGGVGRQPPYDAFWGARYAVVEDPDGNSVGLMSPSDPAHRGAPPSPS